ncbi:UDP-N-acetyl-D-mannosamine dehydrogenase [uncultured Prochlorococcus sp.]|uniref:UDP-N-acetyl-D-mannosamine dehydrogenase n=1 Tax=uncultured Prochlorococcus sp. TaxID=159733 RepID=UPI0025904DE5|nr:UDP-N-acetyl-D-mannosamine dehydrogenase [uncultured Prochlorococcus sp.]
MTKCCVYGLGYIGLPTSILLAKNGYKIHGVEIDKSIIELTNKGLTNIVEPNIETSLKEVVKNGNLVASSKPEKAEIFIIAVPTPFRNQNNNNIPMPDISYVIEAAKSIAKIVKKNDLIILESTSPIGTTEELVKIIENNSDLDRDEFYVAYCPERVIPGNILYELINNDRVVGGCSLESSEKAQKFYKSFCKGEVRITNSATAELVKLTENAYRDVNIAFSNEISLICDQKNIDPYELINLANKHPRVNILKPGCGVGGHCIAVDPWFIASASPELSKIVQLAREVNNHKTKWVLEKIKKTIFNYKEKRHKEPIIGCFGLTYKPNVDDIRESPALKITKELIKNNFKLLINEPNLKNVDFAALYSIEYLLENSDIIVILVGHEKYKSINLEKHLVLDFCGLNY